VRHGGATLALAVEFVAGEGCGGIHADEAVFLLEALFSVEGGDAEVTFWGLRDGRV